MRMALLRLKLLVTSCDMTAALQASAQYLVCRNASLASSLATHEAQEYMGFPRRTATLKFEHFNYLTRTEYLAMTRANSTSKDIVAVATRVIDILEAHGLPCYLFGSTACLLYGSMRTPNDVDVVVNTQALEPDAMKKMVADVDPAAFELHVVHAQGDEGTCHHILWAVLGRKRRCKIDILVPGLLAIPRIPASSFVIVEHLPVMPLLPLLLTKLSGWDKHRNSPRHDHQKKQYIDAWDIYQLVRLAVSQEINAADMQQQGLAEDIEKVARNHCANFVSQYPAQTELWRRLGLAFPLSSDRVDKT